MTPNQRFPLHWPVGSKRTAYPVRSKFKANLGRAIQDVVAEVSRLLYGKVYKSTADEVIISSNVPLRIDGLPRATYSKVQDCGVAVYFTYKKKPMVITCDKWNAVECNMHAIAKTIKGIRDQDRWGVSDFSEKAFTGFLALPAPAEKRKWWHVLGFLEIPRLYSDVLQNYREKMKQAHPDLGGSNDAIQIISDAMGLARKHFGVS